MPSRALQALIIVEVVLCFALPTYFLFWGVVTLPIWLMGASSGAEYAMVHALVVLAGCLGLWALVRVLRFYLSRKAAIAPNWLWMIIFSVFGVVSLWIEMTGQFAGFTLDWFMVVSIILPTLCTVHILVLGMLKSRGQPVSGSPPNTSLERSRDP
jgi:hypothetical protein